MGLFGIVTLACVMGMVHGQTHVFMDSNISTVVFDCFDTNWKNTTVPCDDISNWDVSRVTNMWGLFMGLNTFNEDISNWDVSSVRYMAYMFHGAKAFNQPLNNWNVSSVEDMSAMFENSAFNHTISCWDLKSDVAVYDIFFGTPAASKTHYIAYSGFNPTYTGATIGSRDDPANECICGNGKYIIDSTTTPSECGFCASGKYSVRIDNIVCTDCPAGFYQSEAGQGLCEPCSTNEASFAGSSQCYNASDMFAHTIQQGQVSEEIIVNAYKSRNFGTCSS